MGKFVSGTSLLASVLGCILLASCGSSSSTRVVANQVPATVKLSGTFSCSATTIAADVSLELGKSQVFSACAFNSGGVALTETFAFQSSAPSVLTVANNGQACAGTWDSVTAPAVCTPGATGIAQVTATANGVSSPPMNVYVHQHITNIVVSKVPAQPPTLSTSCLSKAAPLLGPGPESQLYQAFAFNGSTDITSTVGPFTWQPVALPGQTSGSTSVALSSAPANSSQCIQGLQGQCLNEEVATAATPGATEFVASAGGVNSTPMPFTTCPVESISVTPANNSSSTSFTVPTGTSTVLNATAFDSLGMKLTGVPLTWSATDPVSVGVSGANSGNVYASVGTVSSPGAGGGAVTVSCTPPGCNGGITPSFPIYSKNAFGFTVTKGVSTPASPTTFVTTTACTTTTQSCTTRIVPITRSGTAATFSAGGPGTLPFAPNSVKFDAQGSNAYFGVPSTAFGTQGMMVFNGSSASTVTTAAGKVLAVSPDGGTVILSDTVDSPPRVFICTSCNSSVRSATPFLLPNAVAAAFSPDSLKAYIVSGGPCPGTASAGCVMIYSRVDAPQFLQLPAPATDAAFLGEGAFGYVGSSSTASFLATCDHPNSTTFPSGQSFNFPGQILRPLPDGQSLLGLTPPDIQTLTATVSGSGCVPPRGSLAVANTPGTPINLGVGNFTPTQFLISSDGSTAYILGQIQQNVSFPVTAASCALNTSGTACGSGYLTYTYAWTSGPAVSVGMNINVAGLPAADNGTFPVLGVSGPAPNGSGGSVGTFTVANSSGIPATGLSGTASGTETLNLGFILAFHIQSQTTSNISLVGNAAPLSASLSPAGDLLFVGADDNQVHVVDTTRQLDTEQVPLTFPQSNLCAGPGSPATSLQSVLAISSATQDPTTGATTFGYALNVGPPIAVGNIVKVTGMADPGNNGTFVVTSTTSGSFAAVNPIGVTASSQSGTGTAGLACNPDLVVVKP